MKLRLLLFVLLVIIGGTLLIAVNQAPNVSNIQVSACVKANGGDCIRFPTVTGDTLNGETVILPDFFAGEYTLVIVPFNREQQERVIDWLPIAQELQAEYDWLSYYSVGALPDLPAPVRMMISGGMSFVLEPDVRDVSILLYLEDQELFANSLSASALDETQLFILNTDNEVVWQGQGNYSDTLADELREQLAQLNISNQT